MMIYGRYVPQVEEAYGNAVPVAVNTSGILGFNNALPTVHATRIDVLLDVTGNDVNVTLVVAGGMVRVSTLLGTILAGTRGSFVYTGAIGDSCTLELANVNGNTSGNDAVVSLLTVARS